MLCQKSHEQGVHWIVLVDNNQCASKIDVFILLSLKNYHYSLHSLHCYNGCNYCHHIVLVLDKLMTLF